MRLVVVIICFFEAVSAALLSSPALGSRPCVGRPLDTARAAVLVAWRWRRSRRHAGLTLVYAVHEKICEYLRPVRHKQQ